MHERAAFEYVVIRVVPRVERGECLNVGVMLVCRPCRFLAARVLLNEPRLRAFAPFLPEEDLAVVAKQVAAIPRICAGDISAGPIAALSLRERWHWLAAPSSTIVQPGPIHSGLCLDPNETLDRLFTELVMV